LKESAPIFRKDWPKTNLGARRHPKRIEMARKTGKRPVAVAPVPTVTPLDFMIEAYCDPSLPFGDRLRAAIAAAPFIHRRQPQAGGGEVPDEQSQFSIQIDLG
jgi:hypothetical protein